MEKIFFEGLVLQASLIFALGAQNIFILESGLRRNHHLMVSLVCFLCDFVLIMLGVAGAASLFNMFPLLKVAIGVIGVAFLLHYGFQKIFVAEDMGDLCEDSTMSKSLKRSILLAVTFSVLNPHAYLDAFVLIGGFSTKYEVLNDRLVLGMGAACFSGIWFLMLSSASSFMKPLLSSRRVMRYVMSTAGIVLVALSGKLGVDVYGWIQESPFISAPGLMSYPSPPGIVFTSILY